MSQQLLPVTPEKTQHVEGHEANPASALSFQGGLHPVAQLQRTLGNRNVAKLIQTKRLTPEGKIIGLQRKLTVGAADDQYEQEADRVAHQVMMSPDPVVTATAKPVSSFARVQNQTLQTKPLAASITSIMQRQKEKENEVEEKDKSLLAKSLGESAPLSLQRQLTTDKEEAKPILAKSAGSMAAKFEAGDDVETQLSLSKGRGNPLPDPVRDFMEPRFGMDFSHVHVHTGSEALQMNKAVGAQAFTHGSDIYFGAGYSPSNLDLTAHELTHVVQQTGGAPLERGERPLNFLSTLALQRAAGGVLGSPLVQRQTQTVSVGPISLNNTRISVPIPAGATLQASVPAAQTVTWSLEAGTAAVDPGSRVDATGLVTLGGSQAGGRISVRADDSAGSGAFRSREVFLIKPPGSIAATAETGGSAASNYGANFRHTFAAVGGGSGAECEGGRVNEIFPGVPNSNATTHTMTTPFGPFQLSTNNPLSFTAGWGIDATGTMTGDDHVNIGRNGIDIRRFITNTSNPTPTALLPTSFTVTQNLRSLEVPTNTWRAAFATPPHVRGLREPSPGAPEFFVSANGTEHVDAYTGRPAVRNAQAATPTVMASLPAPPPPKRGQPRPVPIVPTTVQITAESTPAGAPLRFSIQGPALGCSIHARTGLLTIGSTAGTVRVRAAGTDGLSFDEVTVTITARPTPTPPAPAPGGGGSGGSGGRHTADSEGPPDPEEATA
jgi:hypothetical protein